MVRVICDVEAGRGFHTAPARLSEPMTGIPAVRVPASTSENLAWLLVDCVAAIHPRRIALVFDGGRWTISELYVQSVHFAGALHDLGVGQGDTVVVHADDGPDWIAAFLGVVRLGAVAALIGTGVDGARVQDMVMRATPRIVISGAPRISVDIPHISLPQLAAAARQALEDPGLCPVRPDDPCYMLMTSGSTGPSKWVLHRHHDISGCLATYGRRVMKLHPGDVVWSVAALATSYGLGNSMYFPVGLGAAAWLETRGRDPERCAQACRVHGVNVIAGVPTWWARLARHVREGRIDPASFAHVRLALSAGEHLDGKVWEAVRAATGMRIVNALGSSEATNLYTSDRPGDPAPGTAGWAVPGYELRIVPVNGVTAPAGQLLVRGPTVMAGYYGDHEATDRTLIDGWLHTGDVVEPLTNGSIRVLGRVGDRIKIGASWIDPVHVQRQLLDVPGVSGAVCLPVTDDDGVPRLVAVVSVVDHVVEVRARIDALVATFPKAEHPRALVVVAHMPVTASGKVDRTQLVDRARVALRDPRAGLSHVA